MSAETGRRIRELRRALGLRSVDVAHLLDVSQGQVSKWEAGNFMTSAKQALTSLADIVAGPEQSVRIALERIDSKGRVLSSRAPEQYSPVAQERGQAPKWVKVLFDDGPGWDNLKATSPCFSSVKPWVSSAMLRKLSDGLVNSGFDPELSRVAAQDLEVHGQSFVSLLMSQWTTPNLRGQDASSAAFFGSYLIGALNDPILWVEESSKMGLAQLSELWDETASAQEAESLPLGWDPDRLEHTPWGPAMDFLLKIAVMVMDNPRKRDFLEELLRQYSEAQDRGRYLLALRSRSFLAFQMEMERKDDADGQSR